MTTCTARQLRAGYGPLFLNSEQLDRCLKQTGWPLTELVIGFAKGLQDNARVLDAGAGSLVNKPAFTHCEYEACDVAATDDIDSIYSNNPDAPYFISDLAPISREDERYDAIVCAQVLEHVPDPQSTIHELARVLRNDGVLLLSTNGTYGVHMPPYNFFNTTPFSLIPMLQQAGLRVTHLVPRGGWFNMAGSTLPTAIDSILRGPRAKFVKPWVMPITHMLWPMLCKWLDRFDDQKRFAESWDIIATPAPASSQPNFDESHLPKRMHNRDWHPQTLEQQYPAMRGFTLDRSNRITPPAQTLRGAA